MNPLAFLRDGAVRLVIEQAAECAAVPVALHHVENGMERGLLAVSGECAACRYVAGLRAGKSACQASRAKGIEAAVRNQLITPFFCHVGFACTLAPIEISGASAILTLGPYCPAEAPDALESDFLEGISALGAGKGTRGQGPGVRAPWPGRQAAGSGPLPVSLRDVRVAPAGVIPAIAEWTVEKINDLWRLETEGDSGLRSSSLPRTSQEEENDLPGKHASKSRSRFVSADPYQANTIAAALAGGKKSQAQDLVRAELLETRSRKAGIGPKRARTIALCAAVLEAAEYAGIKTVAHIDKLAQLIEEVQAAQNEDDLPAAAIRFLRARKEIKEKRGEEDKKRKCDYDALNKILIENLVDGITLDEVAKQLGQTPSAITHRLQRKFGMSFSEYLGRMRVERAKELLRRTKLTIAQVAARVGIADPSNLGKLFRKFENMPPLAYRKRFGGASIRLGTSQE